MKLKNVLSGLQRQKRIVQLHVLSDEKVIFSGSMEKWKATSVDMILYKREVEAMEVKKRLDFHDEVFIFVLEA